MSDDILCVKYSPDQKFIAASLLDSTVKVFFADTLKARWGLSIQICIQQKPHLFQPDLMVWINGVLYSVIENFHWLYIHGLFYRNLHTTSYGIKHFLPYGVIFISCMTVEGSKEICHRN